MAAASCLEGAYQGGASREGACLEGAYQEAQHQEVAASRVHQPFAGVATSCQVQGHQHHEQGPPSRRVRRLGVPRASHDLLLAPCPALQLLLWLPLGLLGGGPRFAVQSPRPLSTRQTQAPVAPHAGDFVGFV